MRNLDFYDWCQKKVAELGRVEVVIPLWLIDMQNRQVKVIDEKGEIVEAIVVRRWVEKGKKRVPIKEVYFYNKPKFLCIGENTVEVSEENVKNLINMMVVC